MAACDRRRAVPSRLAASAGLALSLLAAVSCGPARPTRTAAGGGHQGGGPVTVFAAASLTESFQDLQGTLASTGPRLSVTYDFAGSGTLVTQIGQGAPADVIATADDASMQRLARAGLVGAPATFARNALEILVAPGNPKGIGGLADLARPGLEVVLGDETVPAGAYAAQALRAAGVVVRPASAEVDVKAAVAKVTGGEADAAIVYASDVQAAGARGQGVPIPDSQNVSADYRIAVVKGSSHEAAATAFVDAVVHGPGQAALRRHGFASASAPAA